MWGFLRIGGLEDKEGKRLIKVRIVCVIEVRFWSLFVMGGELGSFGFYRIRFSGEDMDLGILESLVWSFSFII